MKLISTTLALVLGAQAAFGATVTLVTDRSAFDAATTVQVENFNAATDAAVFANTPLVVGDLTLQTTGSDVERDSRNQIEAQPLRFSAFDVDGSTIAQVLLRNSGDTFTISFGTAITAFGADVASMNDFVSRSSITVAGTTFEPPALPVGATDDVVQFLGFTSDMPFTSVTFNFLNGSDGFGVDNVAYGTLNDAPPSAVPLPASLPLLLAGFAGLTALRRRKG